MSSHELHPPHAITLASSVNYPLPTQDHVDPLSGSYLQHGGAEQHEYMNAFPAYPLHPHQEQEQPTEEHHSGEVTQAAYDVHQDSSPVAEGLPIHVPNYPTCPHKEVLDTEAQVAEWIAARSMEFAFTKHGERKTKKMDQEDQDRADAPSEPLPAPVTPIDPSLGQAQEPLSESMSYQTLQLALGTALTSRAPPSPTMQEMEKLAAAAAPETLPSSALMEQHLHNHAPSPVGITRFHMEAHDVLRGSEGEASPAVAESSTGGRRTRGAPQYESIVEYRCCWGGTYRPRSYENKTGQKRQRAPSTKVGCKARFVIRKVSKTGQYNMTYYWQHNGHDPTDIEQIKRMRSRQLPPAIKEHLQKKQEAESRRSREQRAATRALAAARSGRPPPDAGGMDDVRALKRKRDNLQLSNDHAALTRPSYGLEDAHRSTLNVIYPVQDPASIYEPFQSGQGEQSRPPLMVLDPRVVADRALDDLNLQRPQSQPEQRLSLAVDHAHLIADHFRPGTDAQQHHQQMLALIPAPQSGDPGFPFVPTLLGNAPSSGVQQQHLTQISGQPLVQRYHQSQQQLSDLRTPTTQTSLQEAGQRARGTTDGHQITEGASTSAHEQRPASAAHDLLGMNALPLSTGPPMPLSHAYEDFRQCVNMAVIRVHGTLSELEQQSGGVGDGFLGVEGGQEEEHARAEMLEIVRLAEDLAQRVQAVARRRGNTLPRDVTSVVSVTDQDPALRSAAV